MCILGRSKLSNSQHLINWLLEGNRMDFDATNNHNRNFSDQQSTNETNLRRRRRSRYFNVSSFESQDEGAQLFAELNGLRRRLSLLADARLHANRNNQSTEENNQSVDYLELKIIRFVRGWLKSREKVFSMIIILMNAISFSTFIPLGRRISRASESMAQEDEDINADSIISINPSGTESVMSRHSETESEQFAKKERQRRAVRLELVKVLKRSQIFNLMMLFCHGGLMFMLNSDHFIVGDGSQSSYDYFSGVELVFEAVQSKPSYNLSYVVFLVFLMDLLNISHWNYYRGTIKAEYDQNGQVSRFKRIRRDRFSPLLHLLVNLRHLFLTSCVTVLLAPLSLPVRVQVMLILYNSLNQLLRHGYNWYRINLYLDVVERTTESTNTSQESPNESIAGEGIALTDYSYYADVNALSHEEPQEEGWSNWPVRLDQSSGKFSISNRYKFEQLQLLLQILGVKTSIVCLLFYLDAIGSKDSRKTCFLIGCLAELFVAMHHYYDKYYLRYIKGGA